MKHRLTAAVKRCATATAPRLNTAQPRWPSG